MGKTMTHTRMVLHEIQRLAEMKNPAPIKVEGEFRHPDWGREMGGLHKERWAAYDPDAVTRLGDVVRDDL